MNKKQRAGLVRSMNNWRHIIHPNEDDNAKYTLPLDAEWFHPDTSIEGQGIKVKDGRLTLTDGAWKDVQLLATFFGGSAVLKAKESLDGGATIGWLLCQMGSDAVLHGVVYSPDGHPMYWQLFGFPELIDD